MTTEQKNAAALKVLQENPSLSFAERMRLVNEAVNAPSLSEVIQAAWARRLQRFSDNIK